MSLKMYFNILKNGVYLSFISVFLVSNHLLFPYITSKQLFFNVLIEILTIIWLGLIVKYPAVRPKSSWITYGLIAFFSSLLVSSIFGVDFNLSFWGDIERMLGWFHIFHFFLFYLIIITVFKNWQDWRNLFIVSITAATAVCFYSLFKIHYSTIGNTAYVSGYAIFNIFFALILFFRRRAVVKDKMDFWLIGSIYLAAALIMFFVMKATNTRGAYVGLGAGLLLSLVMAAAYSASKKIKIYSLVTAGLSAVLIALVFMFPESGLVKDTPILRTITQISGQAITFQTRLISWQAAAKDFPNHPILGTGYGNYAITFDKYFDPKFYSFTTAETYFDRAHNNLVDLASTAGLLGLLSYLSIFAAVLYYLFKGKIENKIRTNEFILLLSLLLAYFIQNLAVFDSLVTYISLIMTLGYVYWLTQSNEEGGEDETENQVGFTDKELIALLIAAVIILPILYNYNFQVYRMLRGTIDGQIELAKGNIAGAVGSYKKALSLNTPLDRDSRASLVNSLSSRQDQLAALDKAKAKEIADYAISLAEANVKLNPEDSMMQMQLAQSLNLAAFINNDNKDKFNFYSDRALEAIDKSITASPRRVTIYFSKAQIYLSRNEKDKAIETLRYAVNLNPNYGESICYLAKMEVYFMMEDKAYSDMDKCLDLAGGGYLNQLDLLKYVLSHYEDKKDEPRILILYQAWSQLEPSNSKVWVSLSLLYAQAGNKEKAISAAQKAGELDPTLRAAADEFIRKLQ